ncbi:MAG TPA: AbrB/MazE/SpoVT family DNA-binding domain-containing protein [Candidatus Thermoplasmatota archaeon]
MQEETTVTDSNQTQVPSRVRREYHIEPGDRLIWERGGGGTIRVRVRKRGRIEDLVGIAPGAARGDSVEAKKRAQRGGR